MLFLLSFYSFISNSHTKISLLRECIACAIFSELVLLSTYYMELLGKTKKINIHLKFPYFFFFLLFSSPEHEVLMVSYCDQSMSVVRRASSVVRRQQLL